MNRLGFQEQIPLLHVSMVELVPGSIELANLLLVDWGHRLGAVNRPFRQEAWLLELHGEPISVSVSGSIVSGNVAGYRREEVVECSRLCSAPNFSWATRIMLRLWREVCAPLWKCWPVKAAISYSHNAHHRGDLYRFDGWEKVREDCGSNGGGSWSRKRYATDVIAGCKTLWIWCYPVGRSANEEDKAG